MNRIRLVVPQKIHEDIVQVYIQEHHAHNEPDIHGGALVEKLEYDAWLQQIANNANPSTADKSWVPSSTFLATRECDGQLVGLIDIRHELNDILKAYGGHIGFGVRPSERKKGYATQILKQGLTYAKTIGLNNVMLACYKDNPASRKTILACGGVLEKEFALSTLEKGSISETDSDHKIIQIFWISL